MDLMDNFYKAQYDENVNNIEIRSTACSIENSHYRQCLLYPGHYLHKSKIFYLTFLIWIVFFTLIKISYHIADTNQRVELNQSISLQLNCESFLFKKCNNSHDNLPNDQYNCIHLLQQSSMDLILLFLYLLLIYSIYYQYRFLIHSITIAFAFQIGNVNLIV